MTHLRRSAYQVRPAPFRDARALIERVHYSHSTANTAVACHGLYRSDDILSPLLGAAIWMPPLPPAARKATLPGEDWRGVLVLSRLALEADLPTNAASFLLGRSMRLLDRQRWPILLTYADTAQGHTGAIYRATNWTDEGLVDAGDIWIGPDGQQRGRRRGPQTLTVAQMRADGYQRAPAAPKRRFTHRIARASCKTYV